MRAEFFINTDHGIVFTYGRGTLTFAAVSDHMERLLADERFRPEFRQIIDFRDMIPFEVSEEEICLLASRTVFGAESRRGFVVASTLQFGLCRMFGTYRDLEGEPGIRIVREMSEALDWVDIPEKVVEEAFAELRSRE